MWMIGRGALPHEIGECMNGELAVVHFFLTPLAFFRLAFYYVFHYLFVCCVFVRFTVRISHRGNW